MNNYFQIPLSKRARYFSFQGTDKQLDAALDEMDVYYDKEAPRADKVFLLRRALHKGLVAAGPNSEGICSLSMVHNQLVKWRSALRFQNDRVLEYEIVIHSITSAAAAKSEGTHDE